MKTLTNKLPLTCSTIAGEQISRVDVPINSVIEFVEMTKSYHAYYEIHSYSLKCLFNNKEVSIPCSMYVNGVQPKVDCIKDNLHKNKTYFWPEVFDEEFPSQEEDV